MAKSILGVDIGSDSLKLALMNGSTVKKTTFVSMPKGLVRGGRVVSMDSMSELLRNTMKENGIRAQRAACVLSGDSVFVRNVTMPWMTAEQLAINLPFEFRDYITDELKDYVCDYAMVSTPQELRMQEPQGENEPFGRTMELTAAAVPVSMIEDYKEMFRKAGLKMVKAAPSVCAYSSLIRNLNPGPAGNGGPDGYAAAEYCFLDLGYQAVRMHIFRGDAHNVTRELESGLSGLDQVIADAYNVDIHLAHTYLMTNFEGCLQQDFCRNTYTNIAVELMRALNFYRFSNPESRLSDVWLGGGGAMIEPLRETIAGTLDLRLHWAGELLPGGPVPDGERMIQAIGITMD